MQSVELCRYSALLVLAYFVRHFSALVIKFKIAANPVEIRAGGIIAALDT